jgi:methionyl-tRNA synthetase
MSEDEPKVYIDLTSPLTPERAAKDEAIYQECIRTRQIIEGECENCGMKICQVGLFGPPKWMERHGSRFAFSSHYPISCHEARERRDRWSDSLETWELK